jgi:opacity protein-like surface antigen
MFTAYIIGYDANKKPIFSNPYKCNFENYRLLGGVMFQIPVINDEFLLTPYAAIGKAFNVKFADEKINVNTALDNQLIYEAGLGLNFRLDEKMSVNIFMSYDRLSLKTNDIAGVVVPNNNFNQFKAGLGIRYSFM